MALVTISSVYPVTQAELWDKLLESNTLVQVTEGMQEFSAAHVFPLHWQSGLRIETDVTIFGLVTVPEYTIEFTKVNEEAYEIHTREYGGDVQKWNHMMKVEKISAKVSRYTDEVEIEAGWKTWLVCLYARFMYRRRQRKLCQLLLN